MTSKTKICPCPECGEFLQARTDDRRIAHAPNEDYRERMEGIEGRGSVNCLRCALNELPFYVFQEDR